MTILTYKIYVFYNIEFTYTEKNFYNFLIFKTKITL